MGFVLYKSNFIRDRRREKDSETKQRNACTDKLDKIDKMYEKIYSFRDNSSIFKYNEI